MGVVSMVVFRWLLDREDQELLLYETDELD